MGFFELFARALSGFYALVPSYGLAIILLTLTVRLALLPLTIKQTRSMREMQLIQPEIKKIQAKHKGDRAKMNEEMMALYKEHGVNPFGGCLPLLMQMPVLFGLFYVLRTPLNYMSGTKLADALSTLEGALQANRFLGLRLNCSASGTLNPPTGGQLEELDALHQGLAESCGSGLVTALPYLVLVLLMGLTTWYQQKQMQAQRGGGDNPQAAQMQMIGRIMPIMLVVISFGFPSGLVVYWLTTNVWTIVQQRVILAAAPATTGAGPSSKATNKGAGKVGDTGGKPLAGQAKKKGGPQQESAGPPNKAKKPHPSSKKKKRR
ncbi:MAG: YidC/Oxa1 family membrane protein insertase [Actinomycetota bacterium]